MFEPACFRPAYGVQRARLMTGFVVARVSFVSIDDGEFVREPSVPLSVTFASFAINLLALALPLSIMQVYDRIIPNHSLATLAYLFLGLTLAIAIDYVLKTSRSALLSWHATQFVEKVENEGVSRFLRAPNGAFERDPAAVNLNRYAAAAALADYHSGQAKLVAIDLPFVGYRADRDDDRWKHDGACPRGPVFHICCACHRPCARISRDTRFTNCARQSEV